MSHSRQQYGLGNFHKRDNQIRELGSWQLRASARVGAVMKKRILLSVAVGGILVMLVVVGLFIRTRLQAQEMREILREIKAGKTTERDIRSLAASHPSVRFNTIDCAESKQITCSGWSVDNFLLSRLGLTTPTRVYLVTRIDHGVVRTWSANLSFGLDPAKPHSYLWVTEDSSCPCPIDSQDLKKGAYSFVATTNGLGSRVDLTPRSNASQRNYAYSVNINLLTRLSWSDKPVQLLTSPAELSTLAQ